MVVSVPAKTFLINRTETPHSRYALTHDGRSRNLNAHSGHARRVSDIAPERVK